MKKLCTTGLFMIITQFQAQRQDVLVEGTLKSIPKPFALTSAGLGEPFLNKTA